MNKTELKQAVREKIKHGLEICEKHYNRKFSFPSISYDLRGTTAGKAYHSKWKIVLNEGLLLQEGMAFVDDTPLHELGHLIDFEVNPRSEFSRNRRPHGQSWKTICVLMGHNPTRCHSFNTSTLKTRTTPTYKWVCRDCGAVMELSSVRHKRMLTGARRYWKRSCGPTHHFEYAPHVTTPAPVVLPVAAQSPTPPRKPTGGTKKEMAKEIFNRGLTRKGTIAVMMDELGMTKAGASTYYYNFNSGKW